jgi:hypothetical protein
VQRQASPAGEHEVVSQSALNPLLEQCGHGRGDRDGPSGSRCLWMPEVVITHRVFRPQLPGKPTRGLGRVIFTVALPRLVHPNRAAVKIDVPDPQSADLAEPQSRPGRHGQHVPMSLGQPYGGLQLPGTAAPASTASPSTVSAPSQLPDSQPDSHASPRTRTRRRSDRGSSPSSSTTGLTRSAMSSAAPHRLR